MGGAFSDFFVSYAESEAPVPHWGPMVVSSASACPKMGFCNSPSICT